MNDTNVKDWPKTTTDSGTWYWNPEFNPTPGEREMVMQNARANCGRIVSLPHIRTYTAAKFSAGFWLTAWFVFMAGLGSYVGLHLVHVL